MKAAAYAKINWSLSVTGVRADGYHTLRTVMQSVSLCDWVTVVRAGAPDTVAFSCSLPSIAGETNLCVRAARAFFAACSSKSGAEIVLDKQIPTGAGLGGGSADAAVVLRLLNRLHGDVLSDAVLYRLGADLGADVPFCLHGGKCLCTGIGEQLTVLPEEPMRALVIAKGQSGLSTPDMYRRLDAYLRDASGDAQAYAQAYANWFEPVAEQAVPDIRKLKALLLAHGASGAQMTGSGSAVFGWFDDDRPAAAAAEAVRGHGYFAVPARTVSAANIFGPD